MNFEKYLRQEQIKKDATDAASKSVNDIVGKMMREKEYSEWMGKQGFDVLRHANCCKIAFNGGWESRQTEVDELTLQVAEMKSRLNTAYTDGQSAMYTARQTKVDELQKRVDAVKQLIQEYRDLPTEDKTFQHALSIVAYELEQALKGNN